MQSTHSDLPDTSRSVVTGRPRAARMAAVARLTVGLRAPMTTLLRCVSGSLSSSALFCMCVAPCLAVCRLSLFILSPPASAGNSQRSYLYPGSAAFTELVSKPDNREIGLARVLNAYGPLAIILDASGMQNYKGGIYDGSGCSNAPTAGNHAALLVGLGADKQGKQYWSAAAARAGRAEKRRGEIETETQRGGERGERTGYPGPSISLVAFDARAALLSFSLFASSPCSPFPPSLSVGL